MGSISNHTLEAPEEVETQHSPNFYFVVMSAWLWFLCKSVCMLTVWSLDQLFKFSWHPFNLKWDNEDTYLCCSPIPAITNYHILSILKQYTFNIVPEVRNLKWVSLNQNCQVCLYSFLEATKENLFWDIFVDFWLFLFIWFLELLEAGHSLVLGPIPSSKPAT